MTDLLSILAQALPIRWQAPWLLPAVLAIGAAVAAAVLWFYPAQLRPVRRPWRYVIPGLRLLAFSALAVMVAKPVALRARPADDRGVLLVLLDRSRSMSVADRGRKPAELVALADALGLLNGRRAAGTSGVAADFERLRAAVAEAARIQGDLDYARVSGRGVEAAEARVRKQVDDVRGQGRALAGSSALAAAGPALRAKLAPLADLPAADPRGAWVADTRKRLNAAADAIGTFREQADRRLFDADPDVRAICADVERRTRFELAAEALVRPGVGLLSKLGPDAQPLVFAYGDGLAPLGPLRPADPASIVPPAALSPSGADDDDDTPDWPVPSHPPVIWSAGTRIGLNPDGVGSDLNGALAAAVAVAAGKPIRGVLVLSDGQLATGPATAEPTRAVVASAALPPGVPLIAAVAAGPAAPNDVAVAELTAPASAYVGEPVTVRGRVRATGGATADPSALRLAVVGSAGNVGPAGRPDPAVGAGGGEDELSPTAVDAPGGRAAFAVRFDHPGVHELRLRVPAAAGEATDENNVARRWVKVLPDRFRVLIVAGSTGGDFANLRAALARQSWFSVESVVLDPARPAGAKGRPADAKPPRPPPPTDKSPSADKPAPADILRQDVLVLYDVPAAGLSAEQWDAVDRLVARRGGGLVVVAGPAFDPVAYADRPAAAGLLPFNLTGGAPRSAVRTTPPNKQPGRLQPTTESARADVLRLDEVDPPDRRWKDFPGVRRVLPVRSPKTGVRVLLKDMESGQPAATEFHPNGGPGRALYLGTTETWRWRQKGGEAEHERFWRQFVRHAAEEPYAAVRGRLALDLDKVSATEGQPVQVRARVLAADEVRESDDGRPAGGTAAAAATQAAPPPAAGSLAVDVIAEPNSGGVGAAGPDADGGGDRVVRSVRLTESADGSDRLRGTLDDLPPGRYRVRLGTAVIGFGGGGAVAGDGPELPLVVAGGGEAEMHNLAGDADRLKRMAEATGGRLLRLDQLAAVPGLLAAAADARPQVVEWPLWDSPWLFAFVVGCLGAEWALRKRAGLA